MKSRPATSLRLSLLCNAFNSMTQRIYLECVELGHDTEIVIFDETEEALQTIATLQPDLIICPFLTKRIPIEMYSNTPCLIVHPGIEGDRGMSSIDWALLENASQWGVTILQAEEEMDAGDIWSTNNFPIERRYGGAPTKSSLYRFECIHAAVKGIRQALENYAKEIPPRPLDYTNPDVKGTLRPRMTNSDRQVDWLRSAGEIVRIINASDSQPGVLDSLANEKYFLFGAHEEKVLDLSSYSSEIHAILAQRYGAILIRCGQGSAVWITHLKKMNNKNEKSFKLPATMVLPAEIVQTIPIVPEQGLLIKFGSMPRTFQEIFCWQDETIAYLWFDFYNGAMSTDQCVRLSAAIDQTLATISGKILVLMGGFSFFSNGIHLNTIEAANDPAKESWDNINAIDDVVFRILTCKSRWTISALQGNAGAGGVMAAIAADSVVAHPDVVLNPSYKAMNLYGSEYWTFSLPNRVGNERAEELTNSTNPVSARQAVKIGLIDQILGSEFNTFFDSVQEYAQTLAKNPNLDDMIAGKQVNVDLSFNERITQHRNNELEQMKDCFADPMYHGKRRAFVYKSKYLPCVASSMQKGSNGCKYRNC
ncbi:hydrogenase maturation factor HoxX-like isoform X2 [Bradysia coprophila]|nr:hydrogenase maturation factor HoxX-like isoform X2 [Bradysia coprophila]XP_037043714.1 hydrogenase maturation factor HoxX-like isoform X2 [Bradysia coprophila]